MKLFVMGREENICLLHEQCFNYLAAVAITGDRAAKLDLAVRVLLRATPAATQDLRF
jgi:hypothetical protein